MWRRTLSILVVGTTFVSGCSGSGGREAACDRLRELKRPPDPAAEAAELLALANQARAAKGLPALRLHPNLEEKARSWSATMAREGRLYHSRVPEAVTASWERLGENVGQGYVVASIHENFLASPAHAGNLLDPEFTDAGMGVAADAAGTRYVTEVFMKPAPPTNGLSATGTTPTPTVAPGSAAATATSNTKATSPTTAMSHPVPPAVAPPAPVAAPERVAQPPTSRAVPPAGAPPAPVAAPERAVHPPPLVAPDPPSRCVP